MGNTTPDRAILHIDMNNFYASVECLLNPALRGLPVAVCGDKEERRGIVLAKNYLAKAKGVSTGEAIWEAKLKCPDLVTVPPRFDEYVKYSRLAREIYERYTDQIEPFGIDEVWADVTGSRRLFGEAPTIADEIRRTVKSELGLTVSVGVSFNKVFAKLGSDMKKPDAVTVINREDFREKIWDLPSSALLGVGRATEKNLASVGIRTIGQMARAPIELFKIRLGKNGEALWRYANGLDESEVVTRDVDVPDKSVGHGLTSPKDLTDPREVSRFILELCQDIGHRLYVFDKKATGVAISVKNNELNVRQWQTRLGVPTQSPSQIAKEAFALFSKNYDWRLPVRAVSVRAINLVSNDTPYQLDIFADTERIARIEALDRTVETLRRKYGEGIIRNACLIGSPSFCAVEGMSYF
ncbi:MAG: DNA polymerase IV [Clostridia bacterium]|nr:DNA polymerase IV [Clostridia bacterium]